MFLLLSVAFAPGLALFSFFYLRNQLATEPRKTLIQTFIYGAILTFPMLFLQYVLKQEEIFKYPFIQDILFTGILEELFKWLIILLAVYHHVEFNDPYDGVLYGVAVSLGFATVENFIYLLSFGIDTALLRAVLPVSSHALFGVVMGYYFGKAKFNGKNNDRRYVKMALFIPLILHIVYNTIFISENHWIYVMIPFMLFLWWFSLRKVKLAHLALVKMIKEKKHVI